MQVNYEKCELLFNIFWDSLLFISKKLGYVKMLVLMYAVVAFVSVSFFMQGKMIFFGIFLFIFAGLLFFLSIYPDESTCVYPVILGAALMSIVAGVVEYILYSHNGVWAVLACMVFSLCFLVWCSLFWDVRLDYIQDNNKHEKWCMLLRS